MDSMENFRERFEVLEQQTEQLKHQTHALARQARWWRGIACGVIVLALLGFPLQSGKAQYEDTDLAQRIAALEYKLQYVTGGANEVVITGANLRIVNGLGATDTTNGLGNLIVGYNELRLFEPNERTGSHNVVVGTRHNFSRFGGAVVGSSNEISGDFASVTGGNANKASGPFSTVSGGNNNRASGEASSISGGIANVTSGPGVGSAVSGGQNNTANGEASSVSGGVFNLAGDPAGQVAGGELTGSAISGGQNNTASGGASSVSGGENITANIQNGWAAGSTGGTVSGSFRSP